MDIGVRATQDAVAEEMLESSVVTRMSLSRAMQGAIAENDCSRQKKPGLSPVFKLSNCSDFRSSKKYKPQLRDLQ